MARVTHETGKEKTQYQIELIIRETLAVGGARILNRALEIMEEERPGTIMTGQTMRSIAVSPVNYRRGRSGGFEMYLSVGPRTAYAEWGIGTGRAPGTPPPLRRLYEWVREKPRGADRPEWRNWAIAREVQKTIMAEGTRPYFVLERALTDERANIFSGLIVRMRGGLSNL